MHQRSLIRSLLEMRFRSQHAVEYGPSVTLLTVSSTFAVITSYV